jgi:hypothetical protein
VPAEGVKREDGTGSKAGCPILHVPPGVGMDEQWMRQLLNACLLVEEEMEMGPEGWSALEDPLPDWQYESCSRSSSPSSPHSHHSHSEQEGQVQHISK